MNDSLVMGVDIGGTHITAGVVDLNYRKMLPATWTRKKVDPCGEASTVVDAWSEAIKEGFSNLGIGVTKLGIGIPGPFDYEKGTCFIKDQEKFRAMYGLNVKELLAMKLGIEPEQIRFMNDAACFLQGECFSGAGKGYSRTIGITLGTGLGSSIYRNDIAVDADLWNSEFKESIAEDYLSTKWFLKQFKRLTGNTISDVKSLVLLNEKDKHVSQIFQEFGHNLADFLNEFIAREEPKAVVLGGNIAKASILFRKSLEKSIKQEFQNIPILEAALGEEASLIGASSLWYSIN